MAFSYSAAARAGATANAPASSFAGPSTSTQTAPTATIDHLILDAGPLLSLAPLRHLAKSFHTTPMVLAELRDPKAREHWEHLKLTGVDVSVEQPTAEAMARVVAFAKKSGDYAVLSQTDLGVAALTYQYESAANGDSRIRTEPGQRLPPLAGQEKKEEQGEKEAAKVDEEDSEDDTEGEEVEGEEGPAEASESVDSPTVPTTEAIVEQVTDSVADLSTTDTPAAPTETEPAVEAPSASAEASSSTVAATAASATEPAPAASAPGWDEDGSDGGEWISASNVKAHRSKDLGLLPSEGRAAAAPMAAACMTGDYAVQNVLLGMNLGLVGEGGKRISKVRSWVLRCHACFKLCKDSSKRFCPSCGNATLMRTTVSTSAVTGKQTIHLKKNFQYHLRGTKYSIPDPKPGRAKGQQKGGSGLILREDQSEWQEAVHKNQRQREKEEKRAIRGEGSWMDPDWMPEIISVGMSGKGRQMAHNMPAIGHGRKNPNASRKKRK